MKKNITIHPNLVRSRKTQDFIVDIVNTDEGRIKGFQNVGVYEAQAPLLLEWDFSATRLLHNENVPFDLDACCISHDGTVIQVMKLRAQSKDIHMTLPCRWILEIPETLDGITVQEGDTVIMK